MSEDGRPNSREFFAERLRKSLRADTRYSVLDFETTGKYLRVFTDSVSYAIRISKLYQETSLNFKIKIVLLPDRSVGSRKKGICHVGVAPVRRECLSESEQTTQVLFGETFDALQVKGDWVRVRLDADGYIGWVSQGQVTLFHEDEFHRFQALPKVFASDKEVSLFERPNKNSPVLREAVHGTALCTTGRRGSFLEVKLPDGKRAYVRKSSVTGSTAADTFSIRRLLDTAYSFRGISYSWGGRSVKGFDCSGFVQTVFRLHGIELPRDSGSQYSSGEPLGKNIAKLRAGDLLFFSSNGDKITHVAVYIGNNKQFIHSSGFVKINSFDPRRKDFSEKLLSTFVGACRVI